METTSSLIPLLIVLAAFVTCSSLCWAGYRYVARVSGKRRMLDRARRSGPALDIVREKAPKGGTGERLAEGSLRLMDSIGKRIVKEDSADYSKMKVRFVRAGLRGNNVPKIFYGTKGLLLLLPAVLWVALKVFGVWTPVAMPSAYAFYVAAFAGFYLPDIWLRMRREKRKNELFQGFPDALDLLVVCVEAGMAMDAAIHRVAREIALSSPTLSDELRMYNLELRAGLTRQDALQRLAARVDLQDVYALVSLLIQTDKFGTSLVSALKVYSETFRRRRYLKAEEKAAKLPPKLTFPLICLIFPPLMIFTVGPAFIKVTEAVRNVVQSM